MLDCHSLVIDEQDILGNDQEIVPAKTTQKQATFGFKSKVNQFRYDSVQDAIKNKNLAFFECLIESSCADKTKAFPTEALYFGVFDGKTVVYST
jgi:hypothetical protein